MEGTVDTLKIKIETEGAEKAQKSLSEILSAIDKFKAVGNAMQGVAEKSEDAAEGIAQAGEEIEVTLPKAEKSTSVLKKLGDGFKAVVGNVGKFIAKVGKTGMSSLFAQLGKSLTNAVTHIKTFASALKRIAMYRMLRSIIRSITQAIGEGITNIYYYSQAVGTSLAPALDRAKSASLTFKNSIGAAIAPVLESLVPILQKVCAWLVKFNNLIGAVFASLSGKSTYTAAVDTTVKWGDALSSAAGSAKELKRQLMGFDELNVLNDNSGGSGGGGGASTPDYASMFEERAVPQGMFDWMQDFKLVFNDVVLDWSNINGEQLAEKIISGLFTVAGLLVGGVPGAIVGFLLSLFINKAIFNGDGKISKEEWKTIFAGVFGAIGGGIIGFMVGGVPGLLVGVTVGFALTALITSMEGTKINEKTLGDIGYVFELIPMWWDTYIVNWWVNTALPWMEGIWDDFTNTGLFKVFKWIFNNAIGNAQGNSKIFSNWGVDSFDLDTDNPFTLMIENASKNGKQSADSFTTGFTKEMRSGLKRAGATSSKNWRSITSDAVSILGGTDFTGAYNTIDKNQEKGMKLVRVGNRSRWMTESEYVTSILKATDVITPFEVMNTSMQNEWNSIKNNTDGNAGAVTKTINDKFGGINIVTPMNKIQSDLGTHFTSINSLASRKVTEVGGTISSTLRSTDVSTPMDSLKTTLSTKFSEIQTNSTSAVDDIVSNITTSFSTLETDGSSVFETLSTNISTAFTTTQTSVQSAVDSLKSGVATQFNAISNGAATMCENVVDAVIEAMEALNKAKFTVPTWVPDVGGRSFSFNATVPAKMTVTPELMANGGLVESGQLFIARENGPEIVASYGSKSSVMNNDQIVESVSEGVYQAVVSALGNQSTTVNVDGRQLFEIVTERNNAQVRRTGKSPLLT